MRPTRLARAVKLEFPEDGTGNPLVVSPEGGTEAPRAPLLSLNVQVSIDCALPRWQYFDWLNLYSA